MTKIKITQVKSGIDRPDRQKLTLKALGLNKMNASREVEASASILGMVRKVNHLITIEEVQGSSEAEAPQTNLNSTETPLPIAPSENSDEVAVFSSGEK